MANNLNKSSFYGKSPLSQLVVSLLAIIVIGSLLFVLFLLAGKFLFNADLRLLKDPSLAESAKEVSFLKYTLISQDLSYFIIPALLILIRLYPDYNSGVMDIRKLRINDFALVAILALCTFPITSFTGQLNAGMNLPDRFSGVEVWMKEREDFASRLLELIMSKESFMAMLINLLIIAVIPAVGEELIFRGVFQRILQRLFRSGHWSVWITSILFSAIHFQFYGFLPRLILGLIFGYLFLWTRNLWLPFFAHFINNAVPTVGTYVKGWNTINSPPEAALWKQITGLVIPVIIGIMILRYFKRRPPDVIYRDNTEMIDL